MQNGLISFLAALLLGGSAVEVAPTEVRIETGVLVGETAKGVLSFKGIPYAAPPVGNLRWMPPAPAASWNGKRAAKEFGAGCLQPPTPGTPTNFSEDCLTLNVWTPEKRNKPLPVMVYIHGGAHAIGSSAQPIYDGANFARSDVVLVSINFRLGNLGYFAHPALTKEAGPEIPLGNYALMDQMAALKWVRRNIAAFGGDPKNVTVFGQSAGGTDVLLLLTIPSAKSLYEKAIIQSASRWTTLKTLEMKETDGVELASEWGLNGENATPDELRRVPAGKLTVKDITLKFGPIVDGRLLPESPLQSLLSGHFADVPLIMGYNSDDGSIMESFNVPTEVVFSAYPPEKLAEARKLYANEATDDRLLARRMFRDALYGVTTRLVGRSTGAGKSTWLYHFSYVTEKIREKSLGAPHAGDLLYVFDNFDSLPAGPQDLGLITEQDRQMAKTMQSCWVSFAATGIPKCLNAPAWPAYSATSDKLLELGPEIVVQQHFRKAKIDFQEQNFDPHMLMK